MSCVGFWQRAAVQSFVARDLDRSQRGTVHASQGQQFSVGVGDGDDHSFSELLRFGRR